MKKYLAILLTMALLSFAWSASAASVDGTATENNGTITIEGTVTSPVAGQQVTVLVVDDGTNINNLTADKIAYMAQTTSDGNGDYSFTFSMPAHKRVGTYDVYIGGTEVGTPDDTSFTFATEAPTEAPTAAPVAPTVDLATAKPSVSTQNPNAFYYLITITLNDGVASSFVVKHYPTEGDKESDAAVQTFSTSNISNATVKLISVLKDIPPEAENTSITTKATLSYTIGGNPGTVETSANTTLNTTKGY